MIPVSAAFRDAVAVVHNAAAKRHGDTFRASWQAVCYGCGWRGRHTTQAGAAREAAEHNEGQR